MVPMTSIQKKIDSLAPWFHNLHLPDGTQTALDILWEISFFQMKQICSFYSKFKGMACTDIGCNAGFYSFELARLGASVTGIDIDSHYLKQARWAQEDTTER